MIEKILQSGIRRPVDFQILGHGFVPTYRKGDKGKYQLVVTKKGWARLKQKLKAITRKTTPSAFDERVRELKEAQRGWVHYFRMASIQGKPKEVDSWNATGSDTASGMTGNEWNGKGKT